MITIVISCLIVFFAVTSLGRLFSDNFEWYEYFWIGLFAIIVFIQFWSIFLPVNSSTLCLMIMVALISFVINVRKIKAIELPKSVRMIIFVSIPVLIILSYYASQSVGWGDTLLYHLNAVRWGNEYAVVPGLGNLHSRLGINSSFFLFASMLNSWFMQDRVSHLALFIFTSIICMEIIWIFFRSKETNQKIFVACLIPFIFKSVAYNEIIASLSPDYAASLLVIAASIEFLKNDRKSHIVAGLLALILITIKLSTAIFCAFILLVILYEFVVKNEKQKNRNLLIYVATTLLIMTPYIIRNYYLTGWLLYPLPILGMHVDWAMPRGQVSSLYNVINTWAKTPGVEWTKYINAPVKTWFPIWFSSNQNLLEVRLFVSTLLLMVVLLAVLLIKKTIIRISKRFIIFGAIILGNIIYIFSTAPDIRFGGIYVWLLFATVLTIFYSLIKWNKNSKVILAIVLILFTVYISWPIKFDTSPMFRSVRWDQAWPTMNVNGILKPLKEDFCGNSNLPCSPEDNNIKFRATGDLSKGFAPAR